MVRDNMSSDHGAFYQAIVLEWSDGGPFQGVPMSWSGHELYRGLIPDPGTSATISYRIRATDWAGNTVVTNSRSYFIGTPPAQFQRGDINDDGSRNIADAVAGLVYLFGAGSAPGCLDTLDCNDDGSNDISDVVSLLDYLFQAGNQPPEPFSCGSDPTDDSISCDTTQNNCL